MVGLEIVATKASSSTDPKLINRHLPNPLVVDSRRETPSHEHASVKTIRLFSLYIRAHLNASINTIPSHSHYIFISLFKELVDERPLNEPNLMHRQHSLGESERTKVMHNTCTYL